VGYKSVSLFHVDAVKQIVQRCKNGEMEIMLIRNKNANKTNETNDANEEKDLCEDLSYQ